jgi:hypothetical protein
VKFKDVQIHKELRFSLGVEAESGRYYLSIPVSNSMADYEEYYEITVDEFERFKHDESIASEFAQRCRNRHEDARLMQKPGRDRGVPV